MRTPGFDPSRPPDSTSLDERERMRLGGGKKTQNKNATLAEKQKAAAAETLGGNDGPLFV